MIDKCQECILAPIRCNKETSCRFIFNRFGVLECEGNQYKKTLINVMHKKELNDRKDLLNKTEGVVSGVNYHEDLDLSK